MTNDEERSARKLLLLFLIITFGVSYIIEWFMIRAGGVDSVGPLALVGLMWVPGIVALILRRFRANQISALGFIRPQMSYLWIAYALPAVVAGVAYSIAWLLGFAQGDIPWEKLRDVYPGWPGFALLVVAAGTAGVAIGAVFALGEEIGWRGFMLPLMLRARIPAVLAVSGLIWGLWHAPLILFGGYTAGPIPALSAGIFCVATTIDSINYGWLRLASRSIWPAVLLHASHNAYFQQIFDVAFKDTTKWQVAVGESGLIPLLCYAAFASWLIASGRTARAIADETLIPMSP